MKKIFLLAFALAFCLAGCGLRNQPLPTATPSPSPTAEATPTPIEEPKELWGFPIDETHDAFEVDTKGKLGTVLVTVEAGEPVLDGLYNCTFSVWDTNDLATPIQTFERSSLICWDEVLDANFDGYMDFCYTYYHGATNLTFGLYLWDEEQGQFVYEDELFGCGLDPNEETKTLSNYVHHSAVSGVYGIYQWIDGHLTCVRTAAIDYLLNEGTRNLELVVDDWDGDELTEVYRKTFSPSEDIWGEAEKWYDLSYHG